MLTLNNLVRKLRARDGVLRRILRGLPPLDDDRPQLTLLDVHYILEATSKRLQRRNSHRTVRSHSPHGEP